MRTRTRLKERKSAEARAFASYLRTGRYLVQEAPPERKFNPYHDPRNGQFTFAPGGPKSVSNPIFSDRRGFWKRNADSRERASHSASPEAAQIQPSPLSSDTPAVFTPANLRPNPRARLGGIRGPSLNDPLVLEQVFPTLREAPAGAIIGASRECGVRCDNDEKDPRYGASPRLLRRRLQPRHGRDHSSSPTRERQYLCNQETGLTPPIP